MWSSTRSPDAARRPRASVTLGALAALLVAGCARGTPETARTSDPTLEAPRLPTGVRLDPAGTLHDAGSMPLALALSPSADRIVLLLNGWGTQGVQVLDRASGRVLQTLEQPAAFLGLAFAPDGRSLWSSGGNGDVLHRYTWTDGVAERAGRVPLVDSATFAKRTARTPGTRYPSGLAFAADGRTLYAAENLADSLAIIDVAGMRVTRRLATGRYPYAVAVGADGRVYVSNWGASTVSVFETSSDGALRPAGTIAVGRHPSALVLSRDGSRLFAASGSTDRITVVDTRRRRVITELLDPPPAGPGEGSTPNALALSRDGTRLFAAEADANAVAVFDLSATTSGVAGARGDDRLAGRIPTGWYPAALALAGDTLIVANAKGRGSSPNPGGPTPARNQSFSPDDYTLGQIRGTVSVIDAGAADGGALAAYTARVVRANGWDGSRRAASYPGIEHVIYIVKENRTYDQILGDLPQGDGDTSLVFFPRAITPNHHALAERFGIYDRFFVNAEVSADGHNWSMAAYSTDYTQKATPSQYSGRGRSYDYEGTNRGALPPDGDDVAEPASGYLWNLAQRAGVTFRNYGEFVETGDGDPKDWAPANYRTSKPFLVAHTNPDFPGYDLSVTDQRRADVWIADLAEFSKRGSMPALQIVRLPNDHTAGLRAGQPTPRAYMADNDLALGRVIEALSRSPFWKSTAVFVVEDDAQNGADHVDSHRSVLLVISPFARNGVHHRFTNTTDVLATIEEILGLGAMSHFDHFGRPLRDSFHETADTGPYTALVPAVSLDERNPGTGPGARASAGLDLRYEDIADEALFNRILWMAVKGEQVPMPRIARMSALETFRAR